MPGKQFAWPEALLRLGRVRDDLLATALGCTRQAIVARRRALLIPPARPHLVGQLSVDTDAQVARSSGVPRSTVGYRRRALGLPSAYSRRFAEVCSDPGLGHDADRLVALRCGCSRAAVARVREALGLNRHRRPSAE